MVGMIEKQNRVSSIEIKDESEKVINPVARARWQKPSMILKVVNQLKLTNKRVNKQAKWCLQN